MNRDEIVEILSTKICKVVFTKVDGSERTMVCTLEPQMISETYGSYEPSKNKRVNKDVLAVFDLEKDGWRSFRIDAVKSVEPTQYHSE